jgi:TetR/AcrR family transcriptional regulator, regulator of autoinduction and epiphytic fitness
MTTAPLPVDGAVDGRNLRAARSRDAVVHAILSLYAEGELRPGAAAIAARAGVSQSSVFRHFKDIEALVQAAVEAQWELQHDRFAPPAGSGTREERVAAMVEQRLALHDAVGNASRAARVNFPESPTLQRMLRLRRALLRDQVAEQFAQELGRRDAIIRDVLLDALDAACGLEQLEYLRVDRELTREQARDVVSVTLRALLRKGT